MSSRNFHLVHTFHGHTFHSYFNHLKTLAFIQIEKILARFTDKIIVLSEQQKKDICSTYKIADGDKVRIIPLGFDLTKFDKIDPAPQGSRPKVNHKQHCKPSRIGVIGRLTAVKNHNMLLEAMKCLRLSDKLDDFQFVVVGDGELRKAFLEKICNLNLMNAIELKGWQKDMASVYAELDVVALTSKNEGTPVALIEAMAACRPVVATDVGGVTDLLGPIQEKMPEGFLIAERGVMVEAGDAEAMAQAFLYLSENRNAIEPMIRAAKEFVINNFGKDRLFKDIRKLYDEMLG
jgi:glycosyltransferase involved in cell wall biosynthesis